MSFFCAISGEPPQHPVISPKSGLIYERRLIVAHLNQHGTEPSGESLNEDELVVVKASPNAAPPRPPTLTSVPALLHTLQSEWDAVMLESASLRAQYIATRQELAHALYQSDAGMRVVARLVRERNEAREALANVRAATGMGAAAGSADATVGEQDGDVEMAAGPPEPAPLPADVQEIIDSTHAALSAARKKRKTPAVPSPARLPAVPSSTFPAPKGTDVTAFALAPRLSATAFLTGSSDGVVRVWDGGAVLAELAGHEGPITALEWLESDAAEGHIVSGSSDSTIRLWSSTAPYAPLATLTAHSGAITGLSLHPSGQLLLSSAHDGTFALHRLPSGALVSRTMPPDASAARAGGYAALALHPDGVLLALGLANVGRIQIFDIRSRTLAAEFDMPAQSEDAPAGGVTSLSFSENGYSLSSTSAHSPTLTIWDLRKQSIQRTLAAASALTSAAYDSAGAYLVASGDGSVEAWAHKGFARVWEGTVGEGGVVRWGRGAGAGRVWVGGRSGVALWEAEE